MKAAAGWTWLTVWLMKQGIQLHFSGYRHPQTQGKVERFHGALGAALKRRGFPGRAERQRWLDEFRYEYNHERPHEALGMRDTGDRCGSGVDAAIRPTLRLGNTKTGAEVTAELTDMGRVTVEGRSWEISRALAGEWVQLVRIEERILVYYCRSVVRELDVDHPAVHGGGSLGDLTPEV